jgi:TRAP-type C4-dicarboxylate transport system permease small subunit
MRASGRGEKMNINGLATLLAWIFGLVMVGLSFFVTMETIARKLFSFSFQGADELGGYALAVTGALAFTVALIERGHIRIDMIHDRFNPRAQAILNWVSALLMAGLGLFLVRYGWLVIRDTLAYGSNAPTAWATPLIWPQSVWYGALVIFAAVALWLAAAATVLLFRGNVEEVNRRLHAKGAMEELEDELADLRRR